MKPTFLATISTVSNSLEDPIAISRNLEKSLLFDFADPSEMFNGIETADLLV